jgi:hypothetical protein
LEPGQLETYQVARYFGLDPYIVENWSNVEFLDRQEFMFVQMETDRQYQKFLERDS